MEFHASGILATTTSVVVTLEFVVPGEHVRCRDAFASCLPRQHLVR